MTWVKVGQELFDETAELSSDAFRAHVEALGFSNRRLLNLLIPKRGLLKFTALLESEHATAAHELVASGWWEDRGASWWVGCRFAAWQPEKVQVEHRRDVVSAAQRRSRRHRLGDHAICLPTASCHQSTDQSSDDTSVDSTDVSVPDPVTATATAAVTEEPPTDAVQQQIAAVLARQPTGASVRAEMGWAALPEHLRSEAAS